MTHVKDGKEDLILQSRREMGLNPKNGMGKWGFITMEQSWGGGQWVKNC